MQATTAAVITTPVTVRGLRSEEFLRKCIIATDVVQSRLTSQV